MKRSKILFPLLMFSSVSLIGMDSNDNDAPIDKWVRGMQNVVNRSMQAVGLKAKKEYQVPEKIKTQSLLALEEAFQKKYSKPLLATVATDPQHVRLFQTLLEKEGMLLDDASLSELLAIAAKNENVPGIDLLIKKGASPFFQDKKTGYTPLMRAVEGDTTDPQKYLKPTQHTVDTVKTLLQPLSQQDAVNVLDYERQESALGKAEARKLSVSGGFEKENMEHQQYMDQKYMDQIIGELRQKGANPLVGNRLLSPTTQRAEMAKQLAKVLEGEKENVNVGYGPFPRDIARRIAAEHFQLNKAERQKLFESLPEEKKETHIFIDGNVMIPSPREKEKQADASVDGEK